jgi:hypothetical protein
MARDPVPAASSVLNALRPFRRPWPILLAGLVCTIFGLLLSQTQAVPLRLLCLGAGVLLVGIAVARRLQTAGWELEDRAESAGLLAMSAFVALLAYLSLKPSWDSGQIFLIALIAVALVGSFLVLLPRTGRRIAVLVLVVLHFGGILTSVTAVPPRNEPAPWLSMQLWTNFYRHYLTFAYLTNAYHFYSPDPGPPTLMWFHVEYADGTARWIKMPNRRESPVALHHQRMLAAAESANNPITGFPLMNQEQIEGWEKKFKRKYELMPGVPHPSGEDIWMRRQVGESIKFVDPNDGRAAPLGLVVDELPPLLNQYSEPQEMARRLLASYARHIAHTAADPANPSNAVQAVRIYRVIHTLISPRELSEGKDPLDDTTFAPFYMGKYDPDGRLLDPKDPFLFWHIPIIKVAKRYPEPGTVLMAHTPPPPGEPTKIINFVEIHATQSDKFQKSQKGE